MLPIYKDWISSPFSPCRGAPVGKLMAVVTRFLLLCAVLLALPATATSLISIRSVYTTDENQIAKSVFAPGDKIDYHVDVDSAVDHPWAVDIRFQAFPNDDNPDPRLYRYDQTYHVDMPGGLSRFYNPATLPSDAEAYLYTVRITISESGCTSIGCDRDVGENTFTITGAPVSPLADSSPTPILYNPADLMPGRTVFFDSGVQNSGSQGTGVFNVRWFVDGVSVGYGSHSGVPANSTVVDGNSSVLVGSN